MRAQFLELTIFGPEIVTPFADAMCLVDGELRDVPVHCALQERAEHQPLRRHVKHPVLTAMQPAPARPSIRPVQRRVQVSCRDPAGLQSVHLIFHERDKRRDHNGQAIANQSRQLKTE